jgi:(heptosyl)LPS beta-1,4-glucosyltransferase
MPNQPHQLIAVILTKDEVDHIGDCVASLRDWVDAVVVWDSGISDATARAASDAGALVVRRPFDNFAAQRQAVLDSLNACWILFVDADERATPGMAEEVNRLIGDDTINGYWIPRRNFIVGYEMTAGGFYPDHQLRLLRREASQYVAEREVHEIVDVGGAEGTLTSPLLHYNYATWTQFHEKQRFYARYEARILAARGIRPRPHNFVLQPLREFRRRFLTLGGWRDGLQGLRLALLLAWYYGFMPYWIMLTEVVSSAPPLARH